MTQLSFPNGQNIDFGNSPKEEILKKISIYREKAPELFINQNAQQPEQPQPEQPQPEQSQPEQSQPEPTIPEPSKARQLEFGYETGRADYENFSIMLEASLPIGELIIDKDGIRYDSPEELYGPEFANLDYDQRRQFLSDKRNKFKRNLFESNYTNFEEEFADIYKADVQDSAWSTVGKLGAAIASPTSLIPIGQTYKAVAATSGGLGAMYSTLDQEAKKGNIDLKEVAITSAVSAVAGPLLFGATRFVGDKTGKAITNYGIKRQNKKNWNASNKTIDEAETAMAQAVAKGAEKKTLLQVVKESTGVDTATLNKALNTTGRKLEIPNPSEAKLMLTLPKHGIDSQAKKQNSLLDDWVGNISTRIGMLSEPLKLGLRKLDMNQHVKIHNRIKVIKPLTSVIKSIPRKEREKFKSFLLNGDVNAAGVGGAKKLALLHHKNADEVEEVFSGLKSLFDLTHKELTESGYSNLSKIDNYFPRKIKDLEGLQQALGKETKNIIEDTINKRQAQLKVDRLPQEEIEKIINNVLRGYQRGTSSGKISSTEKRTIPRIPPQLLQFYDDPIQTLDNYVRNTVTNIEKRKFFGQDGVNSGNEALNIEESVAKLISRSNKDYKDLDNFDIGQLKSFLSARFVTGEQPMHKILQTLRSSMYMMKLANPLSAITQLGDLSLAARAHGFRHVIGGMFNKARKVKQESGKTETLMESFGLDQVLASEFLNEKVMSKWLHRAFTAGGFRSVDKFGKNTLLKAALNKGQVFSKSKKGQGKLASKYKEAFGEEFNGLLDDLSSGKMSENVKLYLWSELADVQPISLSEMPKSYLQNPNGRMFYTLKTFALKQIDILRRESINEWKKGNKIVASKNAITWAGFLGMGQVSTSYLKDAVSGREPEVSIEDISDRAVVEYFKLLLLNKFAFDKADLSSPEKFIKNAPALVFESLFSIPFPSGDIERNIPVGGELFYRYSEEGRDKYQKQRQKRELEKFKNL